LLLLDDDEDEVVRTRRRRRIDVVDVDRTSGMNDALLPPPLPLLISND
jgi:hypothetical protein